MAKLTREDILKLAQLSKLSLTESEITEFTTDINNILNYVEQLQKVDTKGLVPTSQVTGLVNSTRPDKIIDYGYSPADLLKNVPNVQEQQIKVKRILE
ncbi:MAG TPA: Asp-tRNA(Asn)/Glu-tRNA(Gln) amidotransferase subunit GatC [Patescibacteria group bacterium]|jgi:aspartyl-tRNA(Asn)/glutamyl-tRNA(Gln) amidotransferase subunit C|nr:Asp-tRNA(Asn)/Glu-tRNA(Gln) amidotransferase subunit GatC [Patescibacteria group bacterium]